MELKDLELLWRELYIENSNKKQTYLSDMLARLMGEKNFSGIPALQFEPIKEEDNYIFLTVDSDSQGPVYCSKWNEEKEEWECLGKLFQTYEWGPCMLNRYWNQCAVSFASEELVYLKDVITSCMGEKYGGLLFKGKGIWDGEMLILKLDREEKLQNYYQNQKCYRYNKDSGEWEFFGMLIKQPQVRKKI